MHRACSFQLEVTFYLLVYNLTKHDQSFIIMVMHFCINKRQRNSSGRVVELAYNSYSGILTCINV